DVPDFDGPAWLASMAPRLIREFALDAPARVRRIRAKSGVDGVLKEIGLIQSDAAKTKYFSELLQSGALTPEEQARALKQAGQAIGSDGLKGELFNEYAPTSLDTDPPRAAFVEAVAGIGSDGVKGQLLVEILQKSTPDTPALLQILQCARDIGSDGV